MRILWQLAALRVSGLRSSIDVRGRKELSSGGCHAQPLCKSAMLNPVSATAPGQTVPGGDGYFVEIPETEIPSCFSRARAAAGGAVLALRPVLEGLDAGARPEPGDCVGAAAAAGGQCGSRTGVPGLCIEPILDRTDLHRTTTRFPKWARCRRGDAADGIPCPWRCGGRHP